MPKFRFGSARRPEDTYVRPSTWQTMKDITRINRTMRQLPPNLPPRGRVITDSGRR